MSQNDEEKARILSRNYKLYERIPRKILKWRDKYTIPDTKNYDYHKETIKIWQNNKNKNDQSKIDKEFSWHQQSMSSYTNLASICFAMGLAFNQIHKWTRLVFANIFVTYI